LSTAVTDISLFILEIRETMTIQIDHHELSTEGLREIFVPGRLCLFGEHTDWAGAMRRNNPEISPGCTIVAGINYGLHAKISALEEPVMRIRSTTHDGVVQEMEFRMDEDELGEAAKAGGFWSYAAGVGYIFATEFKVRGIHIDNYRTTLPLKKGLSSSAAFCVLVARAFNLCYGIGMTERGEMQVAFEGERLTPSQCGRMDQAVAFGTVPVLMRYDGDLLKVEPARLGATFHMVLVDLKASKDTVEILSKLQHAYPFPKGRDEENLHMLLGEINVEITGKAIEYLQTGNKEALGKLMVHAQNEFDRLAGPMCPSQLGEMGSPMLHKVLRFDAIQHLIYGGKGVGSQGDGTGQFLCRDGACQDELCSILESQLNVSCLKVTLGSNHT
jgi:galactokinase